MSDEIWSDEVKKIVKDVLNTKESGIIGKDTLYGATPTNNKFDPFNTTGRYIGAKSSYGAQVSDEHRFFYSTREPAVKWFVMDVALDMWDNWFRVMNPKKKDDESIDDAVQPTLETLMAKDNFIRLSVFERRYGTAILLMAFEQQLTREELFALEENETIWALPAYTRNPSTGEITMLDGVGECLQLTPFPRTNIIDIQTDGNPASLRFGLPEFYFINRNAGTTNLSSSSLASGATLSITDESTLKVHWTRLIHDAALLDEHPFFGLSRVDIMFDDAVGYRNGKWGQYQTLFRHGSGFPVLKTTASRKENEDWVTKGGFIDLNARQAVVIGPDEDFKFAGAQAAALNPTAYNDMAFTNFATGTRISQDILKGVSAGRVSGSEVNERSYIRFIGTQQNQSKFVPRELIDILRATGQVEFDGDYVLEFLSAFQINQQDEAAIGFMQARENELKLTYMTLNEVRVLNGLPDVEGGEVVVGRAGQSSPERPPDFPSNQNNPSPTGGEPEDPSEADVVYITLKDGTKAVMTTKSFFNGALENALK